MVLTPGFFLGPHMVADAGRRLERAAPNTLVLVTGKVSLFFSDTYFQTSLPGVWRDETIVPEFDKFFPCDGYWHSDTKAPIACHAGKV